MRVLAVLALLVLSACSGVLGRAGGPVVVEEEPVVVVPLSEEDCLAAGDDGIGGTGCSLD